MRGLPPARAAALTVALGALACEPAPPFREPLRLGGALVSAETLNRGWSVYRRTCRTCHGERGDGQGPTGVTLDPPPRDFTTGLFKFGSVPAGALPRDDDLRRVVAEGLAGTAMLGWAIPREDVEPVVQYLKVFSPRWREEEPGEPVRLSPDPWAGREAAARERGRAVYHAIGRCQACHPAYGSQEEIAGWARALGVPEPEPRARPREPEASRSDYGRPLVAPDFTRSQMRSVRPRSVRGDLYRVVAAGVGGTAMPTWKGAMPEEDLWAVVRYVEGLGEERK